MQQTLTDFLQRQRKIWLFNVRADLIAGIVVALALIPEAIAFSIIAGSTRAWACTPRSPWRW